MELTIAATSLAALAQGIRLEMVHLLMRQNPDGLALGEIARRLAWPANPLSAHLIALLDAGWVVAEMKDGVVTYRANAEQGRWLVDFLTRDCCDGRPELCGFPSD